MFVVVAVVVAALEWKYEDLDDDYYLDDWGECGEKKRDGDEESNWFVEGRLWFWLELLLLMNFLYPDDCGTTKGRGNTGVKIFRKVFVDLGEDWVP